MAPLRLGCGDGLLAESLRAAGLHTRRRGGGDGDVRDGGASLTGVDVSAKLLERARALPGDPYRDLLKADLNLPLGFADDRFDASLCIGVLTYVGPSNKPNLLCEMARITKPGGVVVFTLRSDAAGKWEANASELEAAGAWRLHARSEPMPYLPRNPDYADIVKVNVYAYTVLAG